MGAIHWSSLPPGQGRTFVLIAATVIVALLSTTLPVLTGDIPVDKRSSTYEQMSADTRAMQDEDTANPGMLWVVDGQAAWRAKVGASERSCADCHDAPNAMKGVAARYPAFDSKRGAPVDLEARINICRTEHQQAPALAFESKELLALTAYIARQSRGMAIESADVRLEPFITAGRAIFERRQ